MVHLLEDEREAIAALCERHAVARIYVFGSALRDDFRTGERDIDLLVGFAPLEPYEKARADHPCRGRAAANPQASPEALIRVALEVREQPCPRVTPPT